MNSLAHCIEIHGLHKIEGDRLKATAKAIRTDEGFSAQESNKMAVKQAIATLESDRSAIISQIKKQLPEYFKAPEKVKAAASKQKEAFTVSPKLFEAPEKPKPKKQPKEKLAALDKIEREATSQLKQEKLFEPSQKKLFSTKGKLNGIRKIVNNGGEVVGEMALSHTGDVVNVDNIEVLQKNKGFGTKAIEGLKKEADHRGLTITLTSDAMRGKKAQGLNRLWYKKLGFTKNVGKDKIKGISEEFYYKPKAKLSTTATKPQKTITKADLKDIFSSMKHVRTGQDSKGNFWFKSKGRPRVTIFEVDHIEGLVNTSIGPVPVGSYLKNEIELKTKGEGYTADETTAFHEFEHYLEGAGILSDNDIKALNSTIGGENVTSEQRADFIGKKLAGWRSEKNLRIKRILKKIADFMDAIYEFVYQVRTARGVAADIESGKILAEKKAAGEFSATDPYIRYQMAGEKAVGSSKIINIINSDKYVKKYGTLDELDSDVLVENDLYVHGRSGGMDLGDGMVLCTQNMETARQYGDGGSIHFFEISSDTKTFDLSSEHTKDMDRVVKKALEESVFADRVQVVNEETGQDKDIKDLTKEEIDGEIEKIVRESFAPNDIVDSGQAFDSPEMYQWFEGGFGGYDFVETPDGGVLLNPEKVKSAAIEYNEGETIFKDESAVEPSAKQFQLKGGLKERLEKYQKSIAATLPKQETSGFKETLEPVSDQDLAENRKHSKNIKLSFKTSAKRVLSEMAETTDQYLGAISTRLGNVSPKLRDRLKRLDFDIGTQNAAYVKAVEPLLKKAQKSMTRDELADWDYSRKNSYKKRIDELVEKYNMQKEYAAYRKVLSKLREDALDVGLAIGEIDEYAPRILKDSKGFLAAIRKDDEWPVFSRKIEERAKELDIKVSELHPDVRADIISNMILTGQTGLGGVPATKQRKLVKIPARLNRYYMDSDSALMQHIHGMTKLIEARRFFGKIPKKVAEMRRRLYAAQENVRNLNKNLGGHLTKAQTKDLEGLEKSIADGGLNADQLKSANKQIKSLKNISLDIMPDEQIAEIKKKRNKQIGLEKAYLAYLTKYALQRDYRENIGVYIDELRNKKEISGRDERRVQEILNARFHEHGARGLFQAYRNFSYIDTMGSVVSALTQIGDTAWTFYEAGLLKGAKHVGMAIAGKSRIKQEDVGVTRIAQEFSDPGTFGKSLNFVFKWTGLTKMDAIGSESLLNAALEKYQARAKKEPLKLKRELRPMFENETDSVIDDLNNGEISDNVLLLTYSRLLNFQPKAMSEMPQKYLEAGNGRIFYMLKTFTLKQFDVARNEAYNKIKKGDKSEKIQGLKNLARLSMFFVLANAGADEIKDWILGRKTDFDDRVMDNILRLAGISKFVTWKARTEGVGSAMARQILPPFKFIDAAGKDIVTAGDEKGLEMLSSAPIVGKLAYWHYGRGTSKREDLWDRRLRKHKAKLKKVKDKFEKAKNKAEFRRENRDAINELRKVNRFQGRLNMYRKRINRLKSKSESRANNLRIQELEKKRTEMIKVYLSG